MSLFQPLNLRKWVEEHRHELKPPVGNKMVWRDERDTIIMIVAGPNARKDYHVNATEEFFYQMEGDITVGIIHPDTGKPEDIIIREGDIYLLPANVPHNPRRPAGTVRAATCWSARVATTSRCGRPHCWKRTASNTKSCRKARRHV